MSDVGTVFDATINGTYETLIKDHGYDRPFKMKKGWQPISYYRDVLLTNGKVYSVWFTTYSNINGECDPNSGWSNHISSKEIVAEKIDGNLVDVPYFLSKWLQLWLDGLRSSVVIFL